MSYCVHCGVELSDYEKKCPLCDTPVIDIHKKSAGEPLLVDKDYDETKKINKPFLISIVAFILLIPFAATALLDIIFALGIPWAIYVFFAEVCFFVIVIMPLCRKMSTYIYCTLDEISVILYLFIISEMLDGMKWFLYIALPISLCTYIAAMTVIAVIKTKRQRVMTKIGGSIIPIALLPTAIDIVITHYLNNSFIPVWSWYCTIPMLVLGTTIIILSKSVKFNLWIRKKMFI